MSFIERTAKKLLPIMEEVKKKMIPDKKKGETKKGKRSRKVETLESANEDNDSDEESWLNAPKMDQKLTQKQGPADMKNILGYLNQGEWT